MDAQKEKIGLFLINATQKYQQFILDDVQNVAARYGIEVQSYWADGIGAKQSRDVIRFLNENAGHKVCVFIHPVVDQGDVVTNLARRVLNKGAGLAILNRAWEREIRELRREYPGSFIALVSVDNKRFGQIQSEQFRALLPQGGHVLYVLGNPGVSSAIARREGMLLGISGSAITVSEVEGLWMAEVARDAIYKWLVSPIHSRSQIRLVGCQNDTMAEGAREALESVAREASCPELLQIPLTGGDGLEEQGVLWVNEKKLAATIIMPSPGGPAVDLLAAAWREKRAAPAMTLLEPSSYPPIERLRPLAEPGHSTS